MPTKLPDYWLKVEFGSALKEARAVDASPGMREVLHTRVAQLFRVEPGASFDVRLGALLARLFGKRQEGYRIDKDGPVVRQCYRLGWRYFVWE